MISFSYTNIEQASRLFDPNLVEKATKSMLGKLVPKVRTQISVKVRDRYTIQAREVSRAVKIRRQRLSALEARGLLYTGAAVPLDRFSITERNIRSARGRRRGVTARVLKRGPRKIVKGAFAQDISGRKIFKRRGREQLPINRLFGPSVPQMVDDADVRDHIEAFIGKEAPVEFDRAMRFQLLRANRQ